MPSTHKPSTHYVVHLTLAAPMSPARVLEDATSHLYDDEGINYDPATDRFFVFSDHMSQHQVEEWASDLAQSLGGIVLVSVSEPTHA